MRRYRATELPFLPPSQFSLIQADAWTGKVLTVDGELKNQTDHDWILIFDTLEEAELYAQKRISEMPDVECNLYDHDKKFVKKWVNKGGIRPVHSTSDPSMRWWKLWRWRWRFWRGLS
jgi:hypothetical protein